MRVLLAVAAQSARVREVSVMWRVEALLRLPENERLMWRARHEQNARAFQACTLVHSTSVIHRSVLARGEPDSIMHCALGTVHCAL